jgi:hypothetical protein
MGVELRDDGLGNCSPDLVLVGVVVGHRLRDVPAEGPGKLVERAGGAAEFEDGVKLRPDVAAKMVGVGLPVDS